jgi:hypothetical protein
MKTFRELISWELEQDKKQGRSLAITTEDGSGKLGSCVLRKLRYLTAPGTAEPKSTAAALKPL